MPSAAGHHPAPRADLRQGPGGPLQPHLRPAQDDPRLGSRRGPLLPGPHARCRRGPALHRPPAGAGGDRGYRLADPQALVIANAAKDAFDFLGSPEGELALAQAALYLATAPKSNAVYTAFKAATARRARSTARLMPPKTILNAPTKLMKQIGYGDELPLRPRRAGRLLGPGLLAREARPAGLLRAGRSRLRAGDQRSGWTGGRSCATSEREGSSGR